MGARPQRHPRKRSLETIAFRRTRPAKIAATALRFSTMLRTSLTYTSVENVSESSSCIPPHCSIYWRPAGMPHPWNRPYQILIVSRERELLRRMSRFLALFRYDVHEMTSVDAALERLQVAPPDFLIVDAAIHEQPHRLLHTPHRCAGRSPVYSFLLVSEPTEQQLDEALQAGADDVLTRPLICGELLARLRTAAR
ncbi:MAG TPA: response regulator transcription factor, partial [Planctomycetaceae bacterium]|nr:response regulator transcription factor [Planctomycetaceae bacterium]